MERATPIKKKRTNYAIKSTVIVLYSALIGDYPPKLALSFKALIDFIALKLAYPKSSRY